MAEIIRLYGPRQTGGSVVGERAEQEQRIALRANVTTNVSSFVPSRSPLTPEELYPAFDESRSSLGPALLLLHEAERHLADGEAAAKDDDMVAADDAMPRVQALLPELFCCRALGGSVSPQ